jgi:hypothetical protein
VALAVEPLNLDELPTDQSDRCDEDWKGAEDAPTASDCNTLAGEMTAIIIGIGSIFFLMLAVMTAVAKWTAPGTSRTILLWTVFYSRASRLSRGSQWSRSVRSLWVCPLEIPHARARLRC